MQAPDSLALSVVIAGATLKTFDVLRMLDSDLFLAHYLSIPKRGDEQPQTRQRFLISVTWASSTYLYCFEGKLQADIVIWNLRFRNTAICNFHSSEKSKRGLSKRGLGPKGAN